VIRSNLTYADGTPSWQGIDLTTASPLKFPAWVKTVKQNGYWDGTNIIQFKWWLFLSGLEAPHLDLICGEHGVAKVEIRVQPGLRASEPNMKGFVWDIVVTSAGADGRPCASEDKIWALHPRASGKMAAPCNAPLVHKVQLRVQAKGVVAGLAACYPTSGLKPRATRACEPQDVLDAGTMLEGGAGAAPGAAAPLAGAAAPAADAASDGYWQLLASFPRHDSAAILYRRDFGDHEVMVSPLDVAHAHAPAASAA
jgi:hypothetical protein